MQLYKKPLENQYTGCIPAHYLEIIFSNTENLLEINLQLFAELLKVEAGSQSVGLSFMKIINLLPQYNTYCTNQRHSIETVQKLQKTNQPFVEFTQVPPPPFPSPFPSLSLLPFPSFPSFHLSFLPTSFPALFPSFLSPPLPPPSSLLFSERKTRSCSIYLPSLPFLFPSFIPPGSPSFPINLHFSEMALIHSALPFSSSHPHSPPQSFQSREPLEGF